MLWKRFVRFLGYVRGQSLGRLRKPIIRLRVVHLRQLEVGWMLVWGGVNVLFFPLQESQVSCCKRVQRSYSFNLSVSTCLYREIPSQPELSCLLSGPVLVSGWAYSGDRAAHRLACRRQAAQQQCVLERASPDASSQPFVFLLYWQARPAPPHFLPRWDFLVFPLFRQVWCERTYSGTHQVVLDDISNHYVSRITHSNRENGCRSFSI